MPVAEHGYGDIADDPSLAGVVIGSSVLTGSAARRVAVAAGATLSTATSWIQPSPKSYRYVAPSPTIQGDSLSTLVDAARAVCVRTDDGDSELASEASLLRERLEEIQRLYERALSDHGIELPYLKRDDV